MSSRSGDPDGGTLARPDATRAPPAVRKSYDSRAAAKGEITSTARTASAEVGPIRGSAPGRGLPGAARSERARGPTPPIAGRAARATDSQRPRPVWPRPPTESPPIGTTATRSDGDHPIGSCAGRLSVRISRGQESGAHAFPHQFRGPHVLGAGAARKVVRLERRALSLGHLIEKIAFGGERRDGLLMCHGIVIAEPLPKCAFARWRSTRR